MLVVIWPFIPGSNSEIFKGVSVFLGLLISFGSSSAISNGVAGMVITYMRPFKMGDIVKIGDTTGAVLEKSLLVTRVRTYKNEIITIPNSAILNGNTVNYSSMASQDGLIIHTTVTLGYDIPYPKIYELLIGAAMASEGVIKEKTPFVLQTSLDDWYISYQLNAYIRNPEKMPAIYSEIHKNIHIAFDEAGLEIMSPHYQAIRDGNGSTVPGTGITKEK
jgi:small-conductance mechanosensitive channel